MFEDIWSEISSHSDSLSFNEASKPPFVSPDPFPELTSLKQNFDKPSRSDLSFFPQEDIGDILQKFHPQDAIEGTTRAIESILQDVLSWSSDDDKDSSIEFTSEFTSNTFCYSTEFDFWEELGFDEDAHSFDEELSIIKDQKKSLKKTLPGSPTHKEDSLSVAIDVDLISDVSFDQIFTDEDFNCNSKRNGSKSSFDQFSTSSQCQTVSKKRGKRKNTTYHSSKRRKAFNGSYDNESLYDSDLSSALSSEDSDCKLPSSKKKSKTKKRSGSKRSCCNMSRDQVFKTEEILKIQSGSDGEDEFIDIM